MDYFIHLLWEYSLCLPFVALVGLAYWFLQGHFLRRKGLQRGGGRDNGKGSPTLLLVCYLAGLLSLVWTPPGFWNRIWFWLSNGFPSGVISWTIYPSFNLVPSLFLYLRGELTGGSWVQFMAVGNVLMYLPLGVLLSWIWERDSFLKTMAAGFAVSAITELGQPLFGRSFDIDDLIANTLGVLLGAAVFFPIRQLQRTKAKSDAS